MADIHLERKDRSAWPAIVAIAVLAGLLIWWLMNRGSDGPFATTPTDTGAVAVTSTGETDTELPGAVGVFLRWSEARPTPSAMNPDHSHAATGIRNLAAAVAALAAPNASPNVEDELAIVRRQADTLWQNVASTRHADFVRKAFVSLGALMTTVQQERAPALDNELAEVRRAAEAVRANQPLLDQRTRVQEFFDRAATAVRRMSETTAG